MCCFKSRESSYISSGGKAIMGIVAESDFYDKGYFQSAIEGAIRVRDELGIKLMPKVLIPYPVEGNIQFLSRYHQR